MKHEDDCPECLGSRCCYLTPENHGGLGFCGCKWGFPKLEPGDLIIDRTDRAFRVKAGPYPLIAKNIVMVLRPSWRHDGTERFDVLFRREGAENANKPEGE